MNIVETTAGEMTAKEKAECRSLSFRDDGDLCRFISRDDTQVVMVRDDDGKLLGWGAKVKTTFYYQGWDMHKAGATGYYVRKSERRKGIGSKIFYTLNPPRARKIVFPHDKQSHAFFYALGQVKSESVKRYGIDPKTVRRKPRQVVMEG